MIAQVSMPILGLLFGAYLGWRLTETAWALYMAHAGRSAPCAWHAEELARAKALGFTPGALAGLQQLQAAEVAAARATHAADLSTR